MLFNQKNKFPRIPSIENSNEYRVLQNAYSAAKSVSHDEIMEPATLDEVFRKISYFQVNRPSWRATISVSKNVFTANGATDFAMQAARTVVALYGRSWNTDEEPLWTLYKIDSAKNLPDWRFRFVAGIRHFAHEASEQVICDHMCLMQGFREANSWRPPIRWRTMKHRPKDAFMELVEYELKQLNSDAEKKLIVSAASLKDSVGTET